MCSPNRNSANDRGARVDMLGAVELKILRVSNMLAHLASIHGLSEGFGTRQSIVPRTGCIVARVDGHAGAYVSVASCVVFSPGCRRS
jgi:hypothetical protein